jgi:uncharacterized protein YbjT (DUF2867 family)
MRVAVAGATGAIGRHVVPRLIESGHQVRAIVTKEGEAAALSRLGIDAVVGDLLKLPALVPMLSECDVALHLTTAAPKPGKEANLALNDPIRREGTANLIQACCENGIQRYIQQSIAFLPVVRMPLSMDGLSCFRRPALRLPRSIWSRSG